MLGSKSKSGSRSRIRPFGMVVVVRYTDFQVDISRVGGWADGHLSFDRRSYQACSAGDDRS
jgi:hypothetical protein